MKSIDTTSLDGLSATAAGSARRRTSHCLHQSHDEPIQRMINAMAVDTYVRPHRHPGLWELFTHIRGRALLLTFDDGGRVVDRLTLSDGAVKVLEVPAGMWHSVVALSDDTVVMEVKSGPYIPTGPADFAPWSPPEGDAAVAAMVAWMTGAAPGDVLPNPPSPRKVPS